MAELAGIFHGVWALRWVHGRAVQVIGLFKGFQIAGLLREQDDIDDYDILVDVLSERPSYTRRKHGAMDFSTDSMG